MKVLKKDLKREKGRISLIPESLDDLWHLKHLIEKDDFVNSLTYRRVEVSTDKIRPERVDKKPLRLGIRVESVEFHKFSHRLRIKGVIEEGLEMELGSYHTFNIEPDVELSITKAWKEHQIKRIREAERAFYSSNVIVVTLEEGEAIAGIVRQYGVDELFSIRYGSWKGREKEGGSKKEFFNDLLNQLKNSFHSINAEVIIVAGPGFVKDDFVSFLKEKDLELAKKVRVEQASSIGISGFIEVLKRGAVERIRKEERLTKEVRLLDKLMEEISKDGKVAYGEEEVRKALQYGAIETLLISDEKLMGSKEIEIEGMLGEVERARGKIVVFSTEFEPGKRLNGLGGIAAILRFKI